MGKARSVLRTARLGAERARFEAWVRRVRLEGRRWGFHVVVDAPHGARFATAPILQRTPQGLSAAPRDGERPTLTLRIGENVDLGRGTIIEFRPDGRNELVIEDGAYFLSGVRVVLFDGSIVVGRSTRVRDNALLKSAGRLVIGARSSVGYGAMLHCAESIVLEDMVGLAERVSLLDSDHMVDGSDVYNQEQPVTSTPILLERNALVGANAVLLRGVHLGRNAVVAAGAVVRGGQYPAGWVMGGVPARPLKALPAAPQ